MLKLKNANPINLSENMSLMYDINKIWGSKQPKMHIKQFIVGSLSAAILVTEYKMNPIRKWIKNFLQKFYCYFNKNYYRTQKPPKRRKGKKKALLTKAISNGRIELVPYCKVPICIPRYLVSFIYFPRTDRKRRKQIKYNHKKKLPGCHRQLDNGQIEGSHRKRVPERTETNGDSNIFFRLGRLEAFNDDSGRAWARVRTRGSSWRRGEPRRRTRRRRWRRSRRTTCRFRGSRGNGRFAWTERRDGGTIWPTRHLPREPETDKSQWKLKVYR